ncbi:hypothetical protein K9M47_02160 [Candidatus Gracilibacteria bacterium]|nr:hypothetical protein [Candidatus Gracilibacteria bacterium]
MSIIYRVLLYFPLLSVLGCASDKLSTDSDLLKYHHNTGQPVFAESGINPKKLNLEVTGGGINTSGVKASKFAHVEKNGEVFLK